MPRKVMPLTDVKVRNAKAKPKEFTLSDGDNLFLLVTPTGGKLWRHQFTFNGKREKMALGAYPAVSLADARAKRADAQRKVAAGIDPRAEKKAMKEVHTSTPVQVEDSFEAVAREWHITFKPTWAESHAETILTRLERDVFPWIGGLPTGKITAPEVLAVLRRVESRGALETAHRIKTVCGQVFRYAIATGRATRDVAADLRGALPPVLERHHAAIIDPKEIAELFKAIYNYKGGFVVRCALKLAPLLFLRPGELRHAEWGDFDLDQGMCNIPIERMKLTKMVKEARKGETHLIPLSKQAIELLKELRPLTIQSRYVFPGNRSFLRPMSENTVNAALRSMGYDKDTMTGHGFRAMARTILDEVLHVRPDLIEHQLGHGVKDALGRAYNRTTHIEGRIEMMQIWADYLDKLREG